MVAMRQCRVSAEYPLHFVVHRRVFLQRPAAPLFDAKWLDGMEA